MEKNEFTLEEFSRTLDFHPFFGEKQVIVSKREDGYKIEVRDYDVGIIEKDGAEEPYDASCSAMTFYTDTDGVITVIEHGYSLFTLANKDFVIHTAQYIGKKITDIEENINER